MTKSTKEIKELVTELFEKVFGDADSSLKILTTKISPFYIELYVEIHRGLCYDFEIENHIKGQFRKGISLYSCNHLQLIGYEEVKKDDDVLWGNIKIAYDYEQIIIEE